MISLIHPSRSRPQKAYQTALKWAGMAGIATDYVLSLDSTDPYLDDYKAKFNEDRIHINDNTSVVEATNVACKEAKGDILLYLSDDFDCFPDWGVAIEKAVKDFPPMWLLKVDDCLQRFDVAVLTIPIMSRPLYERLGYFWHPSYKSMFVDEDLYWTCRKLGVIRNAEHLRFEHQHVSVGKAQDDETYRNSAKNWDQGKAVFAQRKAEGFPV
jgi:glycosyltransferase involved in cell wall biosynthesis